MRERGVLVLFIAGLLMVLGVSSLADSAPSWAVGTFRGHSRQSDQDIEVTIKRDGSATRYLNDPNGKRWTTYGTWQRGKLYFSPNSYYVSSTGGGIRLTDVNDSANSVVLRRGGGFSSDFGGGGGYGSVPSWAVGTFRGHSRLSDQDIEISIRSDGSVSRNLRDSDGKRSSASGSYSRGKITLDGMTYYVQQRSNAIRVVDVNDSGNHVTLQRRGGFSGGGGGTFRPASAPLWLIGTFRGYSRLADQEVEIRVTSNGNVTRTLRGDGKGRDTSSGYYRDGKIYINPGGPYYVDRDGEDIRVTEVANRENFLEMRRHR